MKSFTQLITNRRSMRKFTDEPIAKEAVVELMKAALMSPSLNVVILGNSF